MASDEDQETNHKTSQGIWATSIIIQTDRGICKLQQPNIICVQWKLRVENGTPEGKFPGIWFRIYGHHRNQNIIDIIQKRSRYHQSPIEEARRKSDPEAKPLRGNHKSERSDLNTSALEKSIHKEV